MKIKGKILIYILGCVSLIYIISLTQFATRTYTINRQTAKTMLQTESYKYINYVKHTTYNFTDASYDFSKYFEGLTNLPEKDRRRFGIQKMKRLLQSNDNYLAVWTIWDDYKLDNADTINYQGNFRPVLYKANGEICMTQEKNIDSLFNKDNASPHKYSKPYVAEPYYHSFSGKKNDEVLITSFVSPIRKGDDFIAIVGIDIALTDLNDKLKKSKALNEGVVYLMSEQGKILACPDSSFINKDIAEYLPNVVAENNVKEKMLKGEYFDLVDKNKYLNKKALFVFQPIELGNTKTNWYLCVSIPNKILFAESNANLKFIIFIGLIGLLILVGVIYLIAKYLSRRANKINDTLKRISEGNLTHDEKTKCFENNELTNLIEANYSLLQGLNKALHFTKEIAKDNLDTEYTFLSKKDDFGESLVNMQHSLKKAKQEAEKKKIQEQNRNWVTRGLAKFGEIIRQNNQDMDLFAQHIIQEFVNYMEVAQIALFINEDEGHVPQFVLKSAIAYNKPVIFDKKTEPDYELLGRVANSGKILLLNNLPDSYPTITTGHKGDKSPSNLLISPLIFNNITYGLLEILSYNEFLPHQIEFIEKLSENIASVISNVKTNLKTSKLLDKSGEQREVLAQHEEEMRQNLEELQTTQEESFQREYVLKEHLKALQKHTMTAELDINGRVLNMSENMLNYYGFTMESIKEKYFEGFVAQTKEARDNFSRFWEELMKTGSNTRTHIIQQNNKKKITEEHYQLVNQELMHASVLLIAIDKTQDSEEEEQIQEQTIN